MKCNKNYVLILILGLSLAVHGYNLFLALQDKNHHLPHEPHISAPGSLKAAWYRTWGGEGSDSCIFFRKDGEDNFYLAGQTSSFGAGGVDVFLVKYDHDGILQWNRTWGGTDNEKLYSIAVDSINNVYLGGFANITSGILQTFFLSYNSSGQLRWFHTWSGNETYNPWHIACASVNNIYVAGSVSGDGILRKFKMSGDLQWTRTWGGNESESTNSIGFDSMQNIYVAGSTGFAGPGQGDGIVLKYNTSGDLQWSRVWGINESDSCRKITIDSLDNIYVAGTINSSTERILIKYDTTGTQLWNHTWGRVEEGVIEIGNMALDSFGDIYLSGRIIITFERRGLWLYKFDNSGIEQWNDTWEHEQNEEIIDIVLDSSSNLYAVEKRLIEDFPYLSYQSDIFLLKYDCFGVLTSNSSWGGEEEDSPSGIVFDSSENVFVGGSTSSYGTGNVDICLIKFTEKTTPSIPGYDLLLFILLLATISVITVISYGIKMQIKNKD